MKPLVTAALVLALATAVPVQGADFAVADLTWMAGYWTGSDGAVEELWLAPAEGLTVGIHRDTRNKERVFFEYLRIETRSDGVYYLSTPSNQPEAAFKLVEYDPGTRAVFENPGHDFPQRITYRRDGDELSVGISGQIDGEEKSSEWAFTRAQFD